MRQTIAVTSVLVICASLSCGSSASAQDDDKLQWSVTPYLWATDTSVDIRSDGTSVGGVDVSFSDLLDTIDTSFQGHIEAGKGHWSVFTDITFISTSDTDERVLTRIDTESDQSIVDLVAAYWPGGAGSPLSFFGGVRYVGFDDAYTFYLSNGTLLGRLESSESYTDTLIGMRYRFDLSSRWAILLRGDTSFGDSEGSWQLQGLAAYTIGGRQQNRILFGYQYKEAEFEQDALTTDFTYQGPIVGFNFRF